MKQFMGQKDIDIIENLETINSYTRSGIRYVVNGYRKNNVAHDSDALKHAVEMIQQCANELSEKVNESQVLLDAYNDYVEAEFQERRYTKLETKLGLMYSTDDFGNDVEMYYDTDDEMFYGTRNEEIVYELKADFKQATEFINTHDFDDYYNLVAQED